MYKASRELNKYRVDFTWADDWYEDMYSSQPFDTEAEARAYMQRVIDRAALRPDIELFDITIFLIDEKVWDETGDFVTIEDVTF